MEEEIKQGDDPETSLGAYPPPFPLPTCQLGGTQKKGNEDIRKRAREGLWEAPHQRTCRFRGSAESSQPTGKVFLPCPSVTVIKLLLCSASPTVSLSFLWW